PGSSAPQTTLAPLSPLPAPAAAATPLASPTANAHPARKSSPPPLRLLASAPPPRSQQSALPPPSAALPSRLALLSPLLPATSFDLPSHSLSAATRQASRTH